MTTNEPNVLVMTPKTGKLKSVLSVIKVLIGDAPEYAILQVSIYDKDKDFTLIKFEYPVINVNIPESVFLDPDTSNLCKEIVKIKE